ncbi:hypothetical protein F5Y10DRAFT_235332 [Nemania abortiva]|nr:hypothetical protein F5Y10DRAFT_235332 [Nemania abortiva]
MGLIALLHHTIVICLCMHLRCSYGAGRQYLPDLILLSPAPQPTLYAINGTLSNDYLQPIQSPLSATTHPKLMYVIRNVLGSSPVL